MEIQRMLDTRGMQYKETKGGEFNIKSCPFCSDSKGKMDNLWKLYINKNSGLFFCHRCGTSGNANQLVEKLKDQAGTPQFNLVDQYLYQDESGCTHVRMTRREDGLGNKSFYQEILEGSIWSKGGAKRPLQPFRFTEWAHESSIIIVEGEKCALALRSMGFAATTFINGCNGWTESYAKYFHNKHVILLPDNDEPGFKFMSQVATCLAHVVLSYQIVLLPGLSIKGDICDWLRDGGNAKVFAEICEKAEKNSLACLQSFKPSAQVWEELKDLPSIHTPVQDIESDIIPDVLRPWIADIAERMQVPIVCVAVLALTVVGSLIGRKARVYPKKEDDWFEVANLWSMIIMPSGRLKSPIINAVLKPLQELSEQAEREFAAISKEGEIEKAILEAKIHAAKREIQKIASAEAHNRDEKLEVAQKFLVKMQKDSEKIYPSPKRYKIHDATVEKIGELLKANTNGLLLVRDELSGWLSSLDRMGHETDRAFFLESWNGKGSYDVDRILRGSIHIPALCLSILGGIPPSKIESYVESAISGGAGNDGLLQRFGLMVHADFTKDWRLVDRSPNRQAYERVKKALISLDQLGIKDDPENDVLVFRFDAEAQELFYEWLTKLEKNIRAEENECDAFISHISKYRKLVPALALQFFLLKKVDNASTNDTIDIESLSAAIKWARHLEIHARRVYSLALNPQIHAARALAQKIKNGNIPDGACLRDIYRHQWSHLKTRASVDMAVAILMDCHWVIVEEIRQTTGAPSEVLRLNPSLLHINQMAKKQLDRTDKTLANTSVSSVNLDLGHGAIA